MLGCVSRLFATDFTWQHFHSPRADAKKSYAAALGIGEPPVRNERKSFRLRAFKDVGATAAARAALIVPPSDDVRASRGRSRRPESRSICITRKSAADPSTCADSVGEMTEQALLRRQVKTR